MVFRDSLAATAAALLVMVLVPGSVRSQNGEMDRFSRKPRPMHKDIPYLGCAVCKMAVEELWKQAAEARAVAPYGKLGEDELIEMATSLCDADADEGDWIPMLDITQKHKGAPLKLEVQEYMGECHRECRTVAHACAKVFDEYREDVAELLYKQSVSLEKLSSRVCTKWAKECPAKAVPASYERLDEFWYPMDEESWKMRNMEKTINKMSKLGKSAPVKFVDPMGGMMMGSDGWDDDEDGAMDPMAAMMGDMMGGGGGGYGDEYGGEYGESGDEL